MSEIADAILKEFPTLNEAQLEAIAHTEGPLLVIAGPGSGKTLVLVLRTLNILLKGLTNPEGILLCTFTEKAAFELRDRLSLLARKLKHDCNLTSLQVGTIHSLANSFLLRYRHHTPLGNNYEVLDELTQLLFIFDHFEEIVGAQENGKYLGRWSTRWTAIEGMRNYFNKITEELIDSNNLQSSKDDFVRSIGISYNIYVEKLFETNRVDFAHQQKIFLKILDDTNIGPDIKKKIRYVMVDEYQDTNYVQEQMLLRLAEEGSNIAVVGDEDQALYRFRGGTVRNILEFPSHFEKCNIVTLSVNYRSHKDIIKAYDQFMRSRDWSDSQGNIRFRFDKEIKPDPEGSFPDYPALISIWGENKEDEARRFADLVAFLMESKVIEDESQVALLLHSVRQEHSGPYLRAMADRGIPAFCPRARAYFDNEEIRYLVACYAILLGYYGEGRGQLAGHGLREIASYVDECLVELGRNYPDPNPLAKLLQEFTWEISKLKGKQTLNRRLADYFYQFLAHEPFSSLVKNENRARNLAIFSQLLSIFQAYYHYTVITARNREPLRFHFFHSFLRLLYEGGINEYEDPDEPMPKGYVQVMTIHQAKGLEFPVVVVGSLSVQLSSPKDVDRILSPFYQRPPLEPANRITGFDRMRLHYVAFSRAEKVLILTTTDQPKPYFNIIWQGLPQWPYVQQDLLKSLFFRLRHRIPVRKTFSFTSDLKVYETCPRQYEFFRFYQFIPARSAEYFFGSLVHQTIEEIHRWAMDGKADALNESLVQDLFKLHYRSLISRGLRPIGPKQREEALFQVLNYFKQNRPEFERIIDTEVDVSVEKEDYILIGKVDLLLGGDGKLEILDFKSQPRPEENDDRIPSYYQQLCTYAHILETRDGKCPERLMLYWTGEPKREDALMVFPYEPHIVDEAGTHFDKVVKCILNRKFSISAPPVRKVCKECDLRGYCKSEGVL
ncbi:MAG: ATP-dependent helicase [Deltaproteobacteria bacterium]|nr:ATP-dependent helicase [Deltaproteobacteria bacterium]